MEYCDATITLKKRKAAKYSNREHWKTQRKIKQLREEKNKIQEGKYYEKNSKQRAENKDAIRQQQKKDTKKNKNRINAKKEKGENRRKKNSY